MSNNASSPYIFTPTQDWFSFNIPTWRNLFPLVTSSSPRVLEIGSWEGRSAVFLLTELCARTGVRESDLNATNAGIDGHDEASAKGHHRSSIRAANGIDFEATNAHQGAQGEIVCIDHFDLMATSAGRERYKKITHNLQGTHGRYRILPQFSVPALMQLLTEESLKSADDRSAGFDWIYIDGSHEADDTFLDGELAWRLAKKGAIVIFDDYHWNVEPEESVHHPKPGIDAFLTLHRGEYEMLSTREQYQMVLRKTSEMRIGFLAKRDAGGTDGAGGREDEKPERSLADALGYGINIALAADTAYAMPAAVVIRSMLKHTKSRVTIFVVDLGLSEDDKQKLRSSIPEASSATLVFLDLPNYSLTKELGPVWAKVDMLRILPVERVLYLDADILVRSSIRDLWDTDMGGHEIAAARDVGFPNGHDDVEKKPYFNAGVLLIDLAKARLRLNDLEGLCRQKKRARFADQDVLNIHFDATWKPLGLDWNAQGVGTYANYPSPERNGIGMEVMQNPSIVHFTGPVNPSVVEVLNQYIQPYTAKPWGYAGAPGNAFAEEWWDILAHTPWKNHRSGEALRREHAEAMDRVVKEGVEGFQARVRGHCMAALPN